LTAGRIALESPFSNTNEWQGYRNPKGPTPHDGRSPPLSLPQWGVAQLAERLAVNQEVEGSSPSAPACNPLYRNGLRWRGFLFTGRWRTHVHDMCTAQKRGSGDADNLGRFAGKRRGFCQPGGVTWRRSRPIQLCPLAVSPDTFPALWSLNGRSVVDRYWAWPAGPAWPEPEEEDPDQEPQVEGESSGRPTAKGPRPHRTAMVCHSATHPGRPEKSGPG
jgi:hypothetical protein